MQEEGVTLKGEEAKLRDISEARLMIGHSGWTVTGREMMEAPA